MRIFSRNLPEKEAMKRYRKLAELTNVQCRNGNWNYDPYMHGMANGMILARSIIEGNRWPMFLDAPLKWLCDSKPRKGMKSTRTKK